MKNMPKAFSFKTWIFYCLLCISIVLLSACGSGGGGDDGGGAGSGTTSGMGSVSFRLIFEEPASTFASGLLAGKSPSGDICVDYGIKTISAEVFNSSNLPVADGSWDCSDHRGTIDDVPAGADISLSVDGTVFGGGNDWQGKVGNLTVASDQITNAGEVNMKYNGDDVTPPEVESTDPSDEATNFRIDADITSTFSEDMVPASVDEVTFTLESDTTTTAVEGTVTYDLMTMSATFDPTNELFHCTTYTATVASDVEDRAGLNMTDDFSWRFTTFGDDTNPDNKWYKDSDSDRYSDGTEIISCDKPGDDFFLAEDLESTSGDCDDNDININPGAQEVCDGVDNDCDGNVDEDLTRVTSCGVGACTGNTGIETCTSGEWGDDTCNPFDGATPEICDDLDNDCDGSVDEDLTRVTSCGVGACTGNTGIETCTSGEWGDDTCNPFAGAAPEICDDLDNDCDGSVDEDLTRATSCGVGECTGNTGIETCTSGEWGDDTCNPFAGATAEICDALDNDCDGSVDEDLTRATSCGVGECTGNTGIETCTSGEWGDDTCDPFAGATAEICDALDNDCDDSVDEDLIRDTSCGVGECTGNTGIETCAIGEWGDDTCDPFAGAALEICDALDNDCDGSVDEDLTRDTSCGVGECEGNTGFETCTSGEWGDDTCDPFAGATTEIQCDAIDQDCDGSDFCVPSPFDFEELDPTFVDDGESPPPGALTSLSSTRSGITIEIYRETGEVEIEFDTVDNTVEFQSGKPDDEFGAVSLDPFVDISASAFIVNFSIPVSSVSVVMGDYSATIQSDDLLTLEAYSLPDASGVQLDSDRSDLPNPPAGTFGFETLSVTAPTSSCIESIRMIGGSDERPNSVFYDNIIVEAPCVP